MSQSQRIAKRINDAEKRAKQRRRARGGQQKQKAKSLTIIGSEGEQTVQISFKLVTGAMPKTEVSDPMPVKDAQRVLTQVTRRYRFDKGQISNARNRISALQKAAGEAAAYIQIVKDGEFRLEGRRYVVTEIPTDAAAISDRDGSTANNGSAKTTQDISDRKSVD